MRYYLTQAIDGRVVDHCLVDIEDDQQHAYERLHTPAGTGPPAACLTKRLTYDYSGTPDPVTYFDDPDYHLEPLPLGTPRLLSPLDFRGYYDD